MQTLLYARGKKEQSRLEFTRMKKTCLHYEKPSQSLFFHRFRVQTLLSALVLTFSLVAVWLGVFILLVRAIVQRRKESENDPYKEIER